MSLTRAFQLTGLFAVGWLAATIAAPSSQPWIAALQSDAPLFERAQACRQLAVLGGPEAVPALAPLLGDPQLSHYAREVLERIPDPAAGDALRNAAAKLRGPLQVGVVNSLGLRGETAAVSTLAGLAADRDAAPPVVAASLIALGRIGGPEAVRVLRQSLAHEPASFRDAAAEGCVLAAARAVTAGRPDEATALYDAVRAASVSMLWRAAATRGAILTRGAGATALALEALRSSDRLLRDAALAAIRENPGVAPTATLVSEFARAEPDRQVLLIAALLERADERALAAIEAGAGAPAEPVRIASLEALGRSGRRSSLSILLRAVAKGTEAEAAAAFAALARIRVPDTQARILETLPGVPAARRARLIAIIGERNADGAGAELLALARRGDGDESKAALRALAGAAGPRELPELVWFTVASADADRKALAARALANAALKLGDPAERLEPVLAPLRGAPDDNTILSLLPPLGAIVRSLGGNETAARAATSLLSHKSGPVREAALGTLAQWPDATPCLTLLEFARSRERAATEREAALNGAIRLAAVAATQTEPAPFDVAAVFQTLHGLVRTREERLAFVSGVASLRRIEALRLLHPYLDDPEVRTEAAVAVVQIAPALLKTEHAAAVKPVLAHIAANEPDETIRRRAAQLAISADDGAGTDRRAR